MIKFRTHTITESSHGEDGVVEVVVMASQFTTILARVIQDSRMFTRSETKMSVDTILNTLSMDLHVICRLAESGA